MGFVEKLKDILMPMEDVLEEEYVEEEAPEVREEAVVRERQVVNGSSVSYTAAPAAPAMPARPQLTVHTTKVPELKTEIADTLNRISILTGTVPGALNEKLLTPSPLPDVDSALYNAIPAEVLRQRPDVHAAEMAWAWRRMACSIR